MTRINFEDAEWSEGGDWSPLPEGDYNLKIENVEECTSKANNIYQKWTFEVAEGHGTGRKIWHNIVISGSDQAVGYGKSRLKAIAEITGVNVNSLDAENSEDVAPLLGKIVGARLKIKEQEGYDAKNEIHYFQRPKETVYADEEENEGVVSKIQAAEEESPF